jgi:hypothetical protein
VTVPAYISKTGALAERLLSTTLHKVNVCLPLTLYRETAEAIPEALSIDRAASLRNRRLSLVHRNPGSYVAIPGTVERCFTNDHVGRIVISSGQTMIKLVARLSN